MNRTCFHPSRILIPMLLAVALVAVPAAATAASSEPVLDQRIDLDLEKAAAADVVKVFAQILEAEAERDPAVDGELTITLSNVSVRTALTAACESLGCRWHLEIGKKRRLVVEPEVAETRRAEPSLEPSVTVELAEVPAPDAFRALAKVHGMRVELDPAVEGAITASIRDRPLGEVLDRMCLQIHCRWTRVIDGGEEVLRIGLD